MQPANPAVNETTVTVDGFSVRAQIKGDGAPVVILHGAGGISNAPGIEKLSERFQTVALEIPGFGSSAPNVTSGSIRDLAKTISAAVLALNIGKHSVIGTSVGAKVALWHAIDSSDQVEGLVLVSPAAILPDGVKVPTIQPDQLLHSAGMTPMQQTLQEEDLLKRIFGPGRDEELEDAMSKLDIPTLLLFGDADFQIPAHVGRLYRALLPKSYYILVHKAGPLIAHERPEAFASLVEDFLQYKEGFVHSHATGVINP